jgi:hypothetical protein
MAQGDTCRKTTRFDHHEMWGNRCANLMGILQAAMITGPSLGKIDSSLVCLDAWLVLSTYPSEK